MALYRLGQKDIEKVERGSVWGNPNLGSNCRHLVEPSQRPIFFFFFFKSIFVKAMPGSHITHHHYCRKRPLAGQEGDRTLRLQGVHKKGQRSWVPEWVAKTCPNSHRSPRQLASGILETAGGAGVGWVLLCKQAVPMTPTF